VKSQLRILAAGLLCTLATLLSGCAQPEVRPPPPDGQAQTYWRGRLALMSARRPRQ